jgi:hypothetical protein
MNQEKRDDSGFEELIRTAAQRLRVIGVRVKLTLKKAIFVNLIGC